MDYHCIWTGLLFHSALMCFYPYLDTISSYLDIELWKGNDYFIFDHWYLSTQWSHRKLKMVFKSWLNFTRISFFFFDKNIIFFHTLHKFDDWKKKTIDGFLENHTPDSWIKNIDKIITVKCTCYSSMYPRESHKIILIHPRTKNKNAKISKFFCYLNFSIRPINIFPFRNQTTIKFLTTERW